MSTILGDSDLRELWQQELSEMRTRILEMRRLFVEELDARGLELDQSTNQVFLEHHGMFSFTGLEPHYRSTSSGRSMASICWVRVGSILRG